MKPAGRVGRPPHQKGPAHAGAVDLRRPRPADVPHLARLEARLYRHDRIPADEWPALLKDPRRETWVLASPDGPPIGLLLVALGRQNLRIEDLGVAPGHQGQGHGTRLLRHAIRRARRHDKARITLEVRPDNLPALALYQKAGFRRAGTRPRYYEDGATALRLALPLDAKRSA